MTTIALGLATALDTTTARRLHDYGDLDDSGVAAALEQTGLQRGHANRWPGHLARISHVAAVVDDGDDLTLAAFEAATPERERGMLESLFALLPGAADGRSVAWDAADWQLLAQRAYHHELPAPPPVHAWPREALCRLFEGDAHPDAQAGAAALYGAPAAPLAEVAPALRVAVHCCVMDLRWRCVIGDMTAAMSRQRAERVVARAVQTAGGVTS